MENTELEDRLTKLEKDVDQLIELFKDIRNELEHIVSMRREDN